MIKISSGCGLKTHSRSPNPRQIPHHRIESDDYIFRKYELGRKLGQGSFGIVYELLNKETREKYAVKIISKEKAGRAVLNFENEVLIMKSVTHPNLIHLEEVYENKKKLYLVTEICETGELARWIKKYGPIREDRSKLVMRKIVDAISYLHKNDIVHRDLKLENILIKNYDELNDTFEIKITDFGLSSQRETVGTDSMFEEYCGTPLYMAPEIIDNYPYSQLCDVWALGIIMYIILIGRSPFNADSDSKLREQIRKAELNTTNVLYNDLSDEAKDCINRMVKVNPAHRITSSELCSHPWLLDKKLSDIEQKNVLELMSEMLQEQENRSPSSNCAIVSLNNDSRTDSNLKSSNDKKSADLKAKSSNNNNNKTNSTSSINNGSHKHLKYDTNLVKSNSPPDVLKQTSSNNFTNHTNNNVYNTKLPLIIITSESKTNSPITCCFSSNSNKSLDTTSDYLSRITSPHIASSTSSVSSSSHIPIDSFLPKLKTPNIKLLPNLDKLLSAKSNISNTNNIIRLKSRNSGNNKIKTLLTAKIGSASTKSRVSSSDTNSNKAKA